MAKIAIIARQAQLTRMSPFFLQHGYDVDLIQIDVQFGLEKHLGQQAKEDYKKAKEIIQRLRQSISLA